jgi:hypothetical protein
MRTKPPSFQRLATLSRRAWLRAGCGMIGLSLSGFLGLRQQAQARTRSPRAGGRAKSCIILYCWGGMSHHETWDPKPDAPAEVRGDYHAIATATPGIRVGEYLPLLAQQTQRLAIVRSVHHNCSGHGKAMYWNVTGHPPPAPELAVNQPPSRQDWPCLGAMVAKLLPAPQGLPGAVQIPYPLVDNGTLQAGDHAGWLGSVYDPIILRPDRGRPYGGVSRDLGVPVLKLADGVDVPRLRQRRALVEQVERPISAGAGGQDFDHFRRMAADILLSPRVQAAFDLTREPVQVHDAYGEHICGKSVLLARRLVEAGVPLVHVVCAAGDLNGSVGDHWDTHAKNFTRLKNDLLPPLERASVALLNDLSDRGILEQTLIVWLTEFGRTPKLNRAAGRDHYPNVYSVAFAGGGVCGGQVYGSSDKIGAFPREHGCGPNDVHATIFHALGIPADTLLVDHLGRPFPVTDGQPLPLFV